MTDMMQKLQQAVAEDAALSNKLAEIKDVNIIVAELSAFAKVRGLDIAEGELRSAFQAKPQPSDEPLEDDALDAIAGAGSPYCIFTKGCYCIFTK